MQYRAPWKVKDYFLGLDPGYYQVGDAAEAVRLFTQNEPLKLWCMLPKNEREQRIEHVHEAIQDMPHAAIRYISQYKDAELGLFGALIATLKLKLNPVKTIKELFFVTSANEFDTFAKQLTDPNENVRRSARVDCTTLPMWAWALSKFFRDCNQNVYQFWVSLDCHNTERFFPYDLVAGYDDERIKTILKNPQILSGLTLRDLTRLSSVSRQFYFSVWFFLFDSPPTRYEVPDSRPSIYAWLCTMKRLSIFLPPDIRKMIGKLALDDHGDVRVFWN